MIYEGRIATVLPGMDEEFVTRVLNEYFPAVERNGGKPIGIFQTVIGNGNEFYYLFRFENLAQREAVFQSLRGDKAYQDAAARWTKVPSLTNLVSHIIKPVSVPFIRTTAGAP